MMKMKDQKIKKAIIAFLYAVLLATACYLTVEAVKYWTAQQQITQKVSELVTGSVKDITLPDTFKNKYDNTTIKGALNITVASGETVTVYINCTNSAAVSEAYSLFNITVKEGDSPLGTLDCTQPEPLSFELSGGDHTLDYFIEWNATSTTSTGTKTVLLDVWAED